MFDPIQNGATSFNPESNGATSVDQPDHPLISLLRGLGGGTIADTTGVAQSLGRGLTGQDNPFFTQDQKQGFAKNPVQQVVGSAVDDTMNGVGAMSFADLLAHLTKGQTNAITERTMARQGGEQNVSSSDLADHLLNSLGGHPDSKVSDEMMRYINDQGLNAPAELTAGTHSRTGPDILNMRQDLSRWISQHSGWMENMTPEKQAKMNAQQSLSDLVHTMAPGTRPEDKIYSMQAKFGDVPTNLKRAALITALGTIGGGAIGKFFGPLLHGL